MIDIDKVIILENYSIYRKTMLVYFIFITIIDPNIPINTPILDNSSAL